MIFICLSHIIVMHKTSINYMHVFTGTVPMTTWLRGLQSFFGWGGHIDDFLKLSRLNLKKSFLPKIWFFITVRYMKLMSL